MKKIILEILTIASFASCSNDLNTFRTQYVVPSIGDTCSAQWYYHNVLNGDTLLFSHQFINDSEMGANCMFGTIVLSIGYKNVNN